MDIGTGISIAGVWVMVGMLGMSHSVTAIGLVIGAAVAGVLTFIFM